MATTRAMMFSDADASDALIRDTHAQHAAKIPTAIRPDTGPRSAVSRITFEIISNSSSAAETTPKAYQGLKLPAVSGRLPVRSDSFKFKIVTCVFLFLDKLG